MHDLRRTMQEYLTEQHCPNFEAYQGRNFGTMLPLRRRCSFYLPRPGNRFEGICLHGSGDNTYVSSFKMEAAANPGQWKILGGIGEYAGISGEGTYEPNLLPESGEPGFDM